MKLTKDRTLIAYFVMVAWFYLADCFIAHPAHPDIRWIAGVYCGGPFGFVATVAVAITGLVDCVKRGY
ncbi:MAG TPA: hypothetical protein VMU24_10425 [Candidatus Acidoferrales bacterium]|nr:hypothetical protein [Candidatus Acidoferrales bacterium]